MEFNDFINTILYYLHLLWEFKEQAFALILSITIVVILVVSFISNTNIPQREKKFNKKIHKMAFNNLINNIVGWFRDTSERNKLIREFNEMARQSYIIGDAPTLIKASISKGDSTYKHTFSKFNSGFRIATLEGTQLSRDQFIQISAVILNNQQLTRKLVVLGWDTLEIHSDNGRYGCKWKLETFTHELLQANQ